MAQPIVEVTTRSWGSRLRGAFKGIIVGGLLVALASWLLFRNEGRAVRRARALAEGARTVVSVAAERVDPANEAALVHVTGATATNETLSDPLFGIIERAVHLERKAEMYQWVESTSSSTEKKTGGSTETTTSTTYRTDWSERPIDSSRFKEPAGHRNPVSMPFETRRVSAQRVTLGAFLLAPGQIARMDAWTPLPARSTAGLASSVRGRAHLHEGGFYIGRDPRVPQVGDLRVSFRSVPPTAVSVVAAQAGGSFAPYTTRSGGSVDLLRIGTVGADAMFEAAQRANRVTTWVLRLLGLVLMWLGLRLILRPLSVMADVLPALGNLVETGLSGIAFAIALPVSLVIVAVAWIFYRPWLGFSILALAAVGAVVLIRKIVRARRAARAVPPPPPPPPPPLPTTP